MMVLSILFPFPHIFLYNPDNANTAQISIILHIHRCSLNPKPPGILFVLERGEWGSQATYPLQVVRLLGSFRVKGLGNG